MDKLFLAESVAPTLPAFPEIDLSTSVNWMLNGFTGIVTSNAALVIGAGIAMAALPIAIRKIKGFGKSAIK